MGLKCAMKIPFVKRRSIQNGLFVQYFILISLIVILVAMIIFNTAVKIIENEVGQSRVEILKQVGRNINTITSAVTSISNLYYFDESLNAIIKEPPGDVQKTSMRLNSFYETACRYNLSFDNINMKLYTIIYGFNGQRFCSWSTELYNFENIIKKPWYEDAIKMNGKILWVSTYNDFEGCGEEKHVFAAARLLKHSLNNEHLGLFIVNVDEEVLLNSYKSLLIGENNIYICDRDGRIISHPVKSRLGNILQGKGFSSISNGMSGYHVEYDNDDKMLISYYTIPQVEWIIVEKIPLRILMLPMGRMKYITLLLLAVCMPVAFLVSYIIARKISSPIKSLCVSMKQVRQGNMNTIPAIRSWNELEELNNGFNRMIDRIKNLMDDIRKEERLKRKAELDSLQAQINPHFMYNTLYTVKCMINMNRYDNAGKMITSFLNLLRKTYANKWALINIEEEIINLEGYVDIQRLRYPEKFDVVFRVDRNIMSCKIPRLILQPLVENSIFHGIEPSNKKCMITVRGYRMNNRITLKVSDTGIGMNDEQIRQLWEKKHVQSDMMFSSIGITNVHERIRLNFGPGYGLEIHSEPGKGTEVNISLPIIYT